MSCAPRSTACSRSASTAASLAAARERFDERHAQIHGHAAKERPVEVVSYRLRVRVDVPKYQPRQEALPTARPADAAAKGKRKVHFGGKSAVEATLYERDKLGVGALRRRPRHRRAVRRHHRDPAGWTGRVDGYRNLILERADAFDGRASAPPAGGREVRAEHPSPPSPAGRGSPHAAPSE